MKSTVAGIRSLVRLTLVGVFAVVLLGSSIVFAQSPCEQIVVDDAGVFGNRLGDVESSAGQLVNSGADVRIRTIQTYGASGNLDRYESQLEQQCLSWTDASGNRKNNLVVLIISVQERSTGLYYGSQWDSDLSGSWTRIQSEVMNPRFANGDYAGGFIAGLQEINRLIKGQTTAAPPSQGGTSSSAGWIILIVVILLVAALVGLWLFRSYQKSRGKRLAVQQKALLAKQAAAARVNELVDMTQMLEIKVNATAARASTEDAAPLIEGFHKVKILVDQGAQKYSELGHSAGDPENRGLGESQIEVIAQEYQKVLDILNQAGEEVKRVEATLATFQQAIDGFGDRAGGIKASIEADLKKLDSVQKSGFKPDYTAGIISRAQRSLDQAQSLYQNRRFTQAAKSLDDAASSAAEAGEYADALPGKKQETEANIQALGSRIENVKGLITAGRATFDRISGKYSDSSWEPIHGNGTEAENRINWTIQALDQARGAASMDQQDWAKAGESVKQGNAWLDEAETSMQAISTMEANLETAGRDAAGEISAAQADIAAAWKYINAYDDDIRESLEDDLRTAEKKVGSAGGELAKDKPDYFLVIRLAKESNSSADKILAEARTEHEAAERSRSKAVSALRDARASVLTSREYIQNHQQDAGVEAVSLLSSATASLRQAEAASDPDSQASLAGAAENAANAAYSSARAMVESAWQQRQSRFVPPVIILPGGGGGWGSRRSSPFPGSGGGSGGGGGRGGGGSTSWGSSRGGGGGGGGGRGGGGSTHW